MVSEVGWRRTIKTRMLKDSFMGQPQRIPDMVREGTPRGRTGLARQWLFEGVLLPRCRLKARVYTR